MGDMADLEEAIQVARRAVASTPENHSNLALFLNNFGRGLQRRYDRTGDMTDLEEANHLLDVLGPHTVRHRSTVSTRQVDVSNYCSI
jgi:hypothetical protein